jgi:hypothetical protein
VCRRLRYSGAARAIEQSLAHLDPVTVETLRASAAVGRVADPQVVALVTGRTVQGVEDRLYSAHPAHIVRPAPSGAYVFSHDLIRETLLEVRPTSRF